MKRLLVLGTLIVLLITAVSACAASAPAERALSEPAFAPDIGAFANDADGMVFEEAEGIAADTAVGGEVASRIAAQDRLVIQDGNLTIVVSDPAQAVEEISFLAQRMGGFVVSSNLFRSTFGEGDILADSASITIRVPADRFEDARTEIKDGAVEIRSEIVSGQDVTQEYTDLKSRLRNLEATEEQLLEIMETADNTEDALLVLQDLRFISEEIEVIKGRIQFLEQSAALSAISVELLPDAASQPIQIGGWSPSETVKSALEALINTFQLLADVAIWLTIYALPTLLLIFGIPLLALAVLVRRRRRVKADADKDES